MRISKPLTVDVDLQQCDRCKAEQTQPGTPRMFVVTVGPAPTPELIDLCVDCLASLRAFVKAGKP